MSDLQQHAIETIDYAFFKTTFHSILQAALTNASKNTSTFSFKVKFSETFHDLITLMTEKIQSRENLTTELQDSASFLLYHYKMAIKKYIKENALLPPVVKNIKEKSAEITESLFKTVAFTQNTINLLSHVIIEIRTPNENKPFIPLYTAQIMNNLEENLNNNESDIPHNSIHAPKPIKQLYMSSILNN